MRHQPMSRFLATWVFGGLMAFAVLGCDSSEPSNMVEDADAEAIADFERMYEDDMKMMEEDDPTTEGFDQ